MNAPIKTRNRQNRRGIIAVIVALLLVVIIGCIALAVDIGLIKLTRTQLQAASDAASLGGGTELLPGLGKFAYKTPDEVKTAADAAAVQMASLNKNGERAGTYVDPSRDIVYGKAIYDSGAGQWVKTPNATPYNYVEVTTLRNVVGSNSGDDPLPLMFGRIFNRTQTNVGAVSTAVILPANGFYVEPGSDDTAAILPFAFGDDAWVRYRAAQAYYDAHPSVLGLSNAELQLILGADGTPIFGVLETRPNGTQVFHREYFDNWRRTESDTGITTGSGPDTPKGILEVDIYPRAYNPGNYGTINFGSDANSTAVLSRQIEFGLNDNDMSYYTNNTITLSANDPLLATADPGISAGMQAALETILNDCRAIAIFEGISGGGGGNTGNYSLIRFEAMAVVEVNLTGSETNKKLMMQPCTLMDDNAVADEDAEIGEETTIFTPLILIQ